MKLIRISESTLINPEKITAIKIEEREGRTEIIVIVDGIPYSVTKGMDEFLKSLVAFGLESTEQFFAG